jgi:hypothetical protein
LPVIEVHEATDVTDADIRISPTITIQVVSPVEYSVVEEVAEGEFRFSDIVDLATAIQLAKSSS